MVASSTQPSKGKTDTVLLWSCNALVVLILTFVWNLKGDIAVLQDHDADRKSLLEKVSNIELKLNEVQLNVQDLKERTTRIEAAQISSKK